MGILGNSIWWDCYISQVFELHCSLGEVLCCNLKLPSHGLLALSVNAVAVLDYASY
jgi:hypothetical protein